MQLLPRTRPHITSLITPARVAISFRPSTLQRLARRPSAMLPFRRPPILRASLYHTTVSPHTLASMMGPLRSSTLHLVLRRQSQSPPRLVVLPSVSSRFLGFRLRHPPCPQAKPNNSPRA